MCLPRGHQMLEVFASIASHRFFDVSVMVNE